MCGLHILITIDLLTTQCTCYQSITQSILSCLIYIVPPSELSGTHCTCHQLANTSMQIDVCTLLSIQPPGFRLSHFTTYTSISHHHHTSSWFGPNITFRCTHSVPHTYTYSAEVVQQSQYTHSHSRTRTSNDTHSVSHPPTSTAIVVTSSQCAIAGTLSRMPSGLH